VTVSPYKYCVMVMITLRRTEGSQKLLQTNFSGKYRFLFYKVQPDFILQSTAFIPQNIHAYFQSFYKLQISFRYAKTFLCTGISYLLYFFIIFKI